MANNPEIIVIGAGPSGIALAHTLKHKLGFDDFTVGTPRKEEPDCKDSGPLTNLRVGYYSSMTSSMVLAEHGE